MSVIGFLRDITGLFNWNSDDNPTSEQDYMNAVKNWHETEKNLVDAVLWQPLTTYNVGEVVKSPTLGKAYVLECVHGGVNGAVEPEYGTKYYGKIIDDGVVQWKIQGAVAPNSPIDICYRKSGTDTLVSGAWGELVFYGGSLMFKGSMYIFHVTVTFKTGSTATGYRRVRLKMQYSDDQYDQTFDAAVVAGCSTNEVVSVSIPIEARSDGGSSTSFPIIGVEAYQNCGADKEATAILTIERLTYCNVER